MSEVQLSNLDVYSVFLQPNGGEIFHINHKGGIHFAPPTTISYIQVRPPVIDLYEVGLVTGICCIRTGPIPFGEWI